MEEQGKLSKGFLKAEYIIFRSFVVIGLLIAVLLLLGFEVWTLLTHLRDWFFR